MAKQELPTEEELGRDNELCSIAFSRMAGSKVDITLAPFEINGHITKSHIYVAHISVASSDATGTVSIPSKVVVKRYVQGIRRTSELEDTTKDEYRKERAVLDLGIHTFRGAEEGEGKY